MGLFADPRLHVGRITLALDSDGREGGFNVSQVIPTAGGIYAWELKKGGREPNVRVEGQRVFNTAPMAVKAALAGIGLAFVPEQRVVSHLERGELVRVLSDWCPSFLGFHLYYPSRRQPTPAFVVVAKALREGATARESHVKRKR